jgi:hypothetical protein
MQQSLRFNSNPNGRMYMKFPEFPTEIVKVETITLGNLPEDIIFLILDFIAIQELRGRTIDFIRRNPNEPLWPTNSETENYDSALFVRQLRRLRSINRRMYEMVYQAPIFGRLIRRFNAVSEFRSVHKLSGHWKRQSVGVGDLNYGSMFWTCTVLYDFHRYVPSVSAASLPAMLSQKSNSYPKISKSFVRELTQLLSLPIDDHSDLIKIAMITDYPPRSSFDAQNNAYNSLHLRRWPAKTKFCQKLVDKITSKLQSMSAEVHVSKLLFINRDLSFSSVNFRGLLAALRHLSPQPSLKSQPPLRPQHPLVCSRMQLQISDRLQLPPVCKKCKRDIDCCIECYLTESYGGTSQQCACS